jgi:decaprenylphospho-beta-D-erythro-pentofuranosid-2-ulose 2-reductase
MKSGPGILVFGANSAICHELLKLYAQQGARYYLVGRNPQKLQAIADDLEARGGAVAGSTSYDFNEYQQHEICVQRARESLGHIDLAIVAHGSLPDQVECETSGTAVKACMDDNFTSAAIIVQACARQLALQGRHTGSRVLCRRRSWQEKQLCLRRSQGRYRCVAAGLAGQV